jgi:hypothetical protein
MSRLDDELRNAFRREAPPDDFTERLLARVAQQPVPQPRWWQKLAVLFEPPKLRWVAIGVTASLLLAIGAAQYSRLQKVELNDSGKIAVSPSPEPVVSPDKRAGDESPKAALTSDHAVPHRAMRKANPSINHRLAAAQNQKEKEEFRKAGEAAKEKLMLALEIASSALNDAQKAIHDDGLQP